MVWSGGRQAGRGGAHVPVTDVGASHYTQSRSDYVQGSNDHIQIKTITDQSKLRMKSAYSYQSAGTFQASIFEQSAFELRSIGK